MARITELEEQLAADHSGQKRQHYQERLLAAQQQLAVQLRKPQLPSIYEDIQQQVLACTAALNVIDTLWRRYQRVMPDHHL
ncbi:MAG: EscE/YscE/SsaE family type III secretion system needle protein co-chaperone [Ottowia sp.]|nr:EscE/YscE/SsaE family type III secretion system needle protein co-chaperone [Ottowia sp.]